MLHQPITKTGPIAIHQLTYYENLQAVARTPMKIYEDSNPDFTPEIHARMTFISKNFRPDNLNRVTKTRFWGTNRRIR
jgi:hypothetical protein